jgi:hypothetical protein
MLLYATIFIVSLVLAGGIVWFYRTSADTSKAIYNTVIPLSEVKHPADHAKRSAAQKAGVKTPQPWGQKAHQTPGNLARTHAALPTDQAPWGWPGSASQVGEKRNKYGARKRKAAHCSLYEQNKSEPKSSRNPDVGWPYREEKTEANGNVYKVTRRAKRPERTNLKEVEKPWGW